MRGSIENSLGSSVDSIDSREVSPLHSSAIEALGWIGVLTYILAYFAYSHSFLPSEISFLWLNTLAAVFVGVVSLKQKATQSLVIQIVWIGIGLSAIAFSA